MNASPRPATMVAIRGVSCGMVYGAPFKITMSDMRRRKQPRLQYGGADGREATRKCQEIGLTRMQNGEPLGLAAVAARNGWRA